MMYVPQNIDIVHDNECDFGRMITDTVMSSINISQPPYVVLMTKVDLTNDRITCDVHLRGRYFKWLSYDIKIDQRDGFNTI